MHGPTRQRAVRQRDAFWRARGAGGQNDAADVVTAAARSDWCAGAVTLQPQFVDGNHGGRSRECSGHVGQNKFQRYTL